MVKFPNYDTFHKNSRFVFRGLFSLQYFMWRFKLNTDKPLVLFWKQILWTLTWRKNCNAIQQKFLLISFEICVFVKNEMDENIKASKTNQALFCALFLSILCTLKAKILFSALLYFSNDSISLCIKKEKNIWKARLLSVLHLWSHRFKATEKSPQCDRRQQVWVAPALAPIMYLC